MKSVSFALSKRMEKFIIFAIIVNAISLGMETDKWLMANMGAVLILIDRVCLAIFTLEIVLKILYQKLDYFRDGWNVFDFIIVGISFIPTSGGLMVLRSLRVLRLLLLITIMPRLKLIVRSLLVALPNIASITLLMLLLFYVSAVIATKIFGEAFPDWFGTLPDSFFTLFQIMTLESWAMGIVRPVTNQFPYAIFFFVPFVLISAFIILNIFIAVIINGMNEARDHYLRTKKLHDLIAQRPQRGGNGQDIEDVRTELNKINAQIAHLLTKLPQR